MINPMRMREGNDAGEAQVHNRTRPVHDCSIYEGMHCPVASDLGRVPLPYLGLAVVEETSRGNRRDNRWLSLINFR